MREIEKRQEEKDRNGFIRAKLSRLQLPNQCPVCMESADDLVPITAYERRGDRQFLGRVSSTWTLGSNDIARALDSLRGAMIFWVPCCAAHCNVRTEREKYIGICVLFVLIYPFIYVLLGFIAAIRYGAPLVPPVTGLVILVAIILLLGMYSFLPRALERAFRIEGIDKSRDVVILKLANKDYLAMVIETNKMHAERMG